MRTEQEIIQGLRALRQEIETDVEDCWPGELEDQLLLLADVCQILGLSDGQSRLIMGQKAWEHVRGLQDPGPPAWPSREILEHLAAWPSVRLSPYWSQKLEEIRAA